MADKKSKDDHDFPFDNDAVPFPHQNAPGEQNTIAGPADGQQAFDFWYAPVDPGVQIESPDLTDEATFAGLPTSYTEHVEALKREGAISGDVDSQLGSTLESPDPEVFAIVNETTEEPKSTSAESVQASDAAAKTEEKAEEKSESEAAPVEPAPAPAAPKRRTRADVAAE